MWLGRKEFTEIMTALAKLEEGNKDIKEDLKEHIRRTTNLEGRTESIEKHVHMVQGVGGFIGILALLATIGGVLVSYWAS